MVHELNKTEYHTIISRDSVISFVICIDLSAKKAITNWKKGVETITLTTLLSQVGLYLRQTMELLEIIQL
jgi:hypothetical protein